MSIRKMFVVLLLALSACTQTEYVDPNLWEVALITTSHNAKDSTVSYFNENLKLIKQNTYKYSGLGSSWTSPAYDNGYVYFAVNGGGKHMDTEKVVRFDTKTGESVTYYDHRYNILGVDAYKGNIYTVSNQNIYAYVSKYDCEQQKIVNEIEFEVKLTDLVAVMADKVFMLNSEYEGENYVQTLDVYDEEFKHLHTARLEEYGVSGYKFVKHGDKLLIPLWFDSSPEQAALSRILEIDVNTYELAMYEFDLEPVVYDLINYGDKLIALFADQHVATTSTIAIIDAKTMDIVSMKSFGEAYEAIQYKNDTLYAVNAHNEVLTLVSYDLANDFQEIDREVVELQKAGIPSSLFINQ